MIFLGKIPQETRVFVCIALQYKGMGLSEIMALLGDFVRIPTCVLIQRPFMGETVAL